MNNIFEIDTQAPMRLLDVDNVLDNQHWRFCADEVTDETGRFLEDNELTYDRFELRPDAVLPAGTRIKIKHLWGFVEVGLSEPTDYYMTIPQDTRVDRVIHIMLSQYHEQVESLEGGNGRYYFIEAVTQTAPGEVDIVWGT